MWFFKKKEKKDNGLKPVASILPAFAGVYIDILNQNNIKFVSRLQRSGESLKFVTGALLIPEDFFVLPEDYDKAKELYNLFIEAEAENEDFSETEEN
jgi:hypothetical protein